MGNFKDKYVDFIDDTTDKMNEEVEEINNQKDFSTFKETFATLKKILYDFGYSLAGNKKPETEKVDYSSKIESGELNASPLLQTLLDMDNNYRKNLTGVEFYPVSIPTTLDLEEKEYVKKTDEELLAEAETTLLPEYQKEVNKAEEKLESTLNATALDLLKTHSSEEDDILKEQKTYAENLENHQQKMVNQGLINSTINTSLKDEIGTTNRLNLEKIDTEYDVKYREIRGKAELAKIEYQNAIEEYDLDYALDLKNKLNKLKEEEEKRLEEINKYNASIVKQETEFRENALKKYAELRAEREDEMYAAMAKEQASENKYGTSYQKALEYAKRLETAKEYYKNFNKDEVFALIESNKGELGLLLGLDNLTNLMRWNSTR